MTTTFRRRTGVTKRSRTASAQLSSPEHRVDEARYRAIVEAHDDAVCCWLPDTTLTFCNARYREFFGLPAAGFLGRQWLDLVPADEREQVAAFYRELVQRPRRVAYEHTVTAADGTERWIAWVDVPLLDDTGRLLEFQSVGRDISERRRTELALQRANRALRTRSQCSHALMRAESEDALLQEICRLVVDTGGYRMAWIGMALDNAERLVRPVAVAGADEGYVASIRVSWGDNEYGRGPTGMAIRERQPAVARDIATDSRFSKWRDAARAHGFASSIALPLSSDNARCIGALNVYASEADAFDGDEVVFLAELAEDLARGIRALRDRRARAAAEARLRHTAQRMTHLLGASNVILYSLRRNGDRFVATEVSDNIGRLLGYTVADALAEGWWFSHLHPEERATVAADNARLLSEGQIRRLYRFEHRDGRYLWIQDDQRVLREADGQVSDVIGTWTDVTERTRAEQALRDSETRFRATFEQAAVGMSHVAMDGRWLRANDRLCQITGYTHDELLRMRFQDITHPDDLEADLALLGRLRSGEIPHYSLDKRYIRKDGARVWVELTVALVRDAAGAPDYLISVIEDITEARRDKEALREMSALAHLGAWEFDVPSGRILWSEETYRLYGVTPKAFDGTLPAFLALIDPRDRPKMQAWVDACLASRSPADLEFRVVQPGGEVRVLSGRGTLERDAQGRPRRLVGTVQDVTERARSEQALRDSEARLRLALEAAQQGIYDLNVVTGEAKVSPEYTTMLGFDPTTFRETNAAWIERLHPDDREPVAVNYRDYIAGKIDSYRVEFRQRTASGDWKWILSIGSVVERDASGAPLRMLGTHTDITERKLAERALRDSEQRYREMFVANPQPMWVYDLATLRFLAVNDAALKKYGFSRDEFLAMTIKEIRPAEEVARLLANAFAGGEDLDEAGLWQHRTKGGRELLVEISSHVLSFDGRRAKVVLAHDVTERLRVEAERRAANERFEKLFRNAPEAISISEFDTGRFLQVNDAFCATFGYSVQEVIGRTAHELQLWTSPDRRVQVMADLRAGRRVLARAGQARTRSGQLRDTLFSAERIDFGGVECALLMLVDVSERVQAQRQLEAHERQLKELARRLMTKEEEERKALAQILHDRFAQNLAAAKLGLEGALIGAQRAGDVRAPEVKDALQRIVISLDESISDVRGLLGELRPPLLAEFGLRAALRQEVDDRRALNSGTEIALFVEGPPAANCLANRRPPATEYGLFMIAREAVVNALVHARARRVEVRLALDGTRVAIEVRDNGVGFDVSRLHSGHLGLTGMRERAALIGASLQIDSDIEEGTVVTVTHEASVSLPTRSGQ